MLTLYDVKELTGLSDRGVLLARDLPLPGRGLGGGYVWPESGVEDWCAKQMEAGRRIVALLSIEEVLDVTGLDQSDILRGRYFPLPERSLHRGYAWHEGDILDWMHQERSRPGECRMLCFEEVMGRCNLDEWGILTAYKFPLPTRGHDQRYVWSEESLLDWEIEEWRMDRHERSAGRG